MVSSMIHKIVVSNATTQKRSEQLVPEKEADARFHDVVTSYLTLTYYAVTIYHQTLDGNVWRTLRTVSINDYPPH